MLKDAPAAGVACSASSPSSIPHPSMPAKYGCLVGLICNLLIANQAPDSGLPSRHAVAAEGLILLTQPSASNASATAAASFNRDTDGTLDAVGTLVFLRPFQLRGWSRCRVIPSGRGLRI